MSLYEKGNAIKENGIQLMTSLFSDGSSAVLGIYTLRPVALRPDLSIGLPFTLCPDDNTPLWEINRYKKRWDISHTSQVPISIGGEIYLSHIDDILFPSN